MAGGRIWTKHAAGSGYSDFFNGVAYSPELRLYVAVGDNEGVQTSPDGITWTARATPMAASDDPKAVAWGGEGLTPASVFVMVGPGGLTYSSPDGITWTQRQASATHAMVAVVWDPLGALFISLASAGEIQTSVDGVDWSATSIPAEFVANTYTLMVSPSFLVVAGDGGKIYKFDFPTWSVISADGSFTGRFRGSVWSPDLDLYVVVGDDGTIQTSPDATTWTDQTTPDSGVDVKGVAWSPVAGLFVACTSSGEDSDGGIWTSPDGVTWTAQTPAADTAGLIGVAAGRDKFVVVDAEGSLQTAEALTIDPKHALNFRKLLPPGAAWGQG